MNPSPNRKVGRRLPALTLTMVVALGGWGLAFGGPASPSVETAVPTLTLTCEMDLCVAEASHVTPGTDHEVVFLWQTSPAPGLPENRADTLRRPHPATPSQQLAHGNRHHVTDVVWHSDIRCDETVTVAVTGEGSAPVTRTVTKPVPDDPDGAFCSAYGMPDAIR